MVRCWFEHDALEIVSEKGLIWHGNGILVQLRARSIYAGTGINGIGSYIWGHGA